MTLRINFGAILCLLLFAGTAQAQNFTVQLHPIEIAGFNGVQSAASALYNGKILVLGGRTDGLHKRQPFAAFLTDGNNPLISVIDPVTGDLFQADVNTLPATVVEQLLGTNLQLYQQDSLLILTGGYGFSPTANEHVTHNKLCVVQLPQLIDAVVNGQDIAPYFTQVADDYFMITGGQLGYMDGIYYLVGGHDFFGRYNPMNHPTFVQQYSNRIKRFTLDFANGTISYTILPDWEDAVNLHRRDYNMLPQIFPDGSHGFTAFSGVFQEFADLPYLNSVDIRDTGYTVNNVFQHKLNQYHCGHAGLYDADQNKMYNLFFGGISQFYFDSNAELVQDNNVPFVPTIGLVTRSADGSMTEEQLELMPGLMGAGSEFIIHSDLPVEHDVVQLSEINLDTFTLGYLIGGIHSQAPNIFFNNETLSEATASLYEVRIVPAYSSGIKVLNKTPSILASMQLHPNPAVDSAMLEFELDKAGEIVVTLQSPDGKLIVQEYLGVLQQGNHQFGFKLQDFPNGVYPVTLSVDQEQKALQLVIMH
jgi:hypothetical protein